MGATAQGYPLQAPYAGAMGRLRGSSNQAPFASHSECMESEYHNRQLRRFAQEFNKARGRPPPEEGGDDDDDDDAFRSRICADLMRA